MEKEEFKKLNYCLELLAINDIISDKKELLKYECFKYLNKDELCKFIDLAEKRKDSCKKFIKNMFNINYNEAIKFGKENKEKYIQLYNLNHANHHNNIFCDIKNQQEEYLDLVERVYKKEAKEIFESLVNE